MAKAVKYAALAVLAATSADAFTGSSFTGVTPRLRNAASTRATKSHGPDMTLAIVTGARSFGESACHFAFAPFAPVTRSAMTESDELFACVVQPRYRQGDCDGARQEVKIEQWLTSSLSLCSHVHTLRSCCQSACTHAC